MDIKRSYRCKHLAHIRHLGIASSCPIYSVFIIPSLLFYNNGDGLLLSTGEFFSFSRPDVLYFQWLPYLEDGGLLLSRSSVLKAEYMMFLDAIPGRLNHASYMGIQRSNNDAFKFTEDSS